MSKSQRFLKNQWATFCFPIIPGLQGTSWQGRLRDWATKTFNLSFGFGLLWGKVEADIPRVSLFSGCWNLLFCPWVHFWEEYCCCLFCCLKCFLIKTIAEKISVSDGNTKWEERVNRHMWQDVQVPTKWQTGQTILKLEFYSCTSSMEDATLQWSALLWLLRGKKIISILNSMQVFWKNLRSTVWKHSRASGNVELLPQHCKETRWVSSQNKPHPSCSSSFFLFLCRCRSVASWILKSEKCCLLISAK